MAQWLENQAASFPSLQHELRSILSLLIAESSCPHIRFRCLVSRLFCVRHFRGSSRRRRKRSAGQLRQAVRWPVKASSESASIGKQFAGQSGQALRRLVNANNTLLFGGSGPSFLSSDPPALIPLHCPFRRAGWQGAPYPAGPFTPMA